MKNLLIFCLILLISYVAHTQEVLDSVGQEPLIGTNEYGNVTDSKYVLWHIVSEIQILS